MKKHFTFNPFMDVRWCPFARFITLDQNLVSTRPNQIPDANCIGFDCAAWVVVSDRDEQYEGYCGLININ